jgi:phosphoenolpyruvate synthase/pyruvate phosphate dikinase
MKKNELEKLINDGFKVPAIIDLLEVKKDKFYAVRSNDILEDQRGKSNAGKFETVLMVRGSEISRGVDKVIESGANDFFIQEMLLKPDFSGVVLAKGSKKTIVLNNGYCEAITSGKVTGTCIIIDDNKRKEFGSQEEELIYDEKMRPVYMKNSIARYDEEDIFRIENLTSKLMKREEVDNINLELSVKGDELYILQMRPYNG